MIAKIENIYRIPTIVVDGTPVTEMAYITYRTRFNKYADFANEGIRLFSVNLNFSEMPINEIAPVLVFQKVYFSENDIRTHLSQAIHTHPNYTSPIWFGHEKTITAEQLKLAFCRAMLYGYGM